jgi:signal transduction histidine kinase
MYSRSDGRPQAVTHRWAADGGEDEDIVESVDSLYDQLGRSDLARHLAAFYQSLESQLAVATTFVRRGLDDGNRCVYFTDENTPTAFRTALRAAGANVDARVEAGDLVIRPGIEAYRDADFDPHRLIEGLEETCDASVADGYEGLWLAGETSWHFHTELSYDHVVDFEADFDATCPDLPVTALCQYDLGRFCENSVAKALWTHEQVVYRYTVCDNPFYVPPEEFRSAATRPLNTQLMLEQAYTLAQATTQIERREQRLAVVNRVLRHDIRNDLNVARGILDLVREAAVLDEDHAARLDTATAHVDDVLEKADKARYVERTLRQSRVVETTLAPVIERARERVSASQPDAEVRVVGNLDLTVAADTNLDIALTELCLYALRTQDNGGRVTMTVSSDPAAGVHVDISYPGASVSANDREVLAHGTETQLQHCQGLGLWLATWIAENGQGGLEIPGDADHQFRLRLRRPAEPATN